MSKSVIEVRIIGDNRDLKRALDGADGDISRFSTAASAGMRIAGAAALGLGAGALIAVPKIMDLGLKLEAMGIKSQTVFAESLGGVQAWAKELAPSLGMTSAELVGAAANMGDLLKPMGFTSKQAADMSTEMLDLSGALSAWSGGQYDAAEVSEILSKAMLGERDQLKSLGISISEADVAARLAEKGQTNLTGASLEQAKALATQELILEKSTDAQKAWTDGSFDNIKAQNKSEASMRQLGQTLTTAIYPILQNLIPIVEDVATWIGDNLPVAAGIAAAVVVPMFVAWAAAAVAAAASTLLALAPFIAIAAAVAAIGAAAVWAYQNVGWFRDAVDTVARFFTDTVWPIMQQTWEIVRTVVQSIVDWVRTNWDTIQAVTTAVFDAIWSYVETVWDTIYGVIDGSITAIRGVIEVVTSLIRGDWEGVWDGIKTFVSGIWEAIKSIVSGAIEVVKGYLSTAMAVISSAWGVIWDGIKTRVSDIWDGIKTFVSGGIDAIVGFIGGLPGRVVTAIGDGFSGLWNAFAGVVNRIIRTWNNLSFTFPSFDGDWNGPLPGGGFTIGGWTIPTPDLSELPRFHTGGMVPGRRGSEMLAVLEAGERVTSADDVAAESLFGDRPITLVIEGRPFTAMLAEHDRNQVAGLMAGVR